MPCQETIKKHVEFSNLKCEKSSEEKLFCYDAAGKCHVRIIDNLSRLALRGTVQARKQRE